MVSYNSILDIQFNNGEVVEPVLLTEAKDFCRIDIGTDDTLITAIITAARMQCEAYTGLGFIEREVTAIVNNENGGIYLPYGPIIDITSVVNSEGDTLVLDTDYTTFGNEFKRILTPKETDLTIVYTAGYAALPEVMKIGLLNAIYYMYDNRAQAAEDIGPIAKMILNPFRRV